MKAEAILREYYAFVQLADDLCIKSDKLATGGQLAKHDHTIALRKLKTAVAKFRMTNHMGGKPKSAPPQFNWLAQ